MAQKIDVDKVITQHQLPKLDQNNFNNAIRDLDNHHFAKCLSSIDAIIKKFPNCADVIAVRGLAIHGVHQFDRNSKDEKKRPKEIEDLGSDAKIKAILEEDPYAICKRAIQCDFKNVLAWHAMGNLHRQDKNFPEALKCLKQAAKVEQLPANYLEGTQRSPFSANLHRDLFNLAIQLRDWDTAVDSRQRAVGWKSGIRHHWTGYSLSHLMAGHVELASGIADTMCKAMEAGDTQPQINEMLFYRAELKMQLGEYKQAVQILLGNEPGIPKGPSQKITDRIEQQRLLAKCYIATRAKDKAKKAIESLLEMRTMERDAVLLYAQAEGLQLEPIADPEGGLPRPVKPSTEFVAILDDLATRFPKCDAAKRLALDYCDGSNAEDFVRRLKVYIVPFVRNFVPSLVTVLESLYCYVDTKVPLIEKTFMEWKELLEKGEGNSIFNKDGSDEKNPTHLLAVYEFLSSHFCKKGDFTKAHEFIDKAIVHTPTHEVLYLSKARIFNAEGKSKEAGEYADTAQRLDKQDKYLNNKAAQYLLRAGDIESAEKRLAMFFKPSPVAEAHLQSFELQYTWYERELGCSYLYTKKDYYAALQALLLIEKHQEDNHADLVDFHGYTMRKNNCRQWVDVIKTEDEFNGTNQFLQACPHIIRAYIGCHDLGSTEAVMKAHTPREEINHPEEAEMKRIKKLQKDFILTPDVENPLQKSQKYVESLQKYKKNSIETHELAFEIAIRGNRPLAAASAIAHISRIIKKENRGGAMTSDLEKNKKLMGELKKRLEEHVSKNKIVNKEVAELVKSSLGNVQNI